MPTTRSFPDFQSCLQEHYLKILLYETPFKLSISPQILPELNKEIKLKSLSLKNVFLNLMQSFNLNSFLYSVKL